jgi:hypothetical protein
MTLLSAFREVFRTKYRADMGVGPSKNCFTIISSSKVLKLEQQLQKGLVIREKGGHKKVIRYSDPFNGPSIH